MRRARPHLPPSPGPRFRPRTVGQMGLNDAPDCSLCASGINPAGMTGFDLHSRGERAYEFG